MSCAKVQTEMLSIHLLPKLIFLSLHFLSLLTVATQGICVLQHKTKNYTALSKVWKVNRPRATTRKTTQRAAPY